MKIIFYRITIIKRRRPVMDDAALNHILFYFKFKFSARLIITKFNDVTAGKKRFTLSERILDSVPILPCVKSLYVILLLLNILQSPPLACQALSDILTVQFIYCIIIHDLFVNGGL